MCNRTYRGGLGGAVFGAENVAPSVLLINSQLARHYSRACLLCSEQSSLSRLSFLNLNHNNYRLRRRRLLANIMSSASNLWDKAFHSLAPDIRSILNPTRTHRRDILVRDHTLKTCRQHCKLIATPSNRMQFYRRPKTRNNCHYESDGSSKSQTAKSLSCEMFSKRWSPGLNASKRPATS